MTNELKALKNVIKKTAKTVGIIITIPISIIAGLHTIPTTKRLIAEKAGFTGTEFSLLGGIAGFFYSLISGGYIIDNYSKNPLHCLAPAGVLIGTNIISGIYEIYRHEKNKLNSSAKPTPVSTIPASPSGLEKKVKEEQKPQIKPQPSKHEIPNPWDIEIDEIEDVRYSGLNDYRRGN